MGVTEVMAGFGVESWRKTLGREEVPVLEVSGHLVLQGL